MPRSDPIPALKRQAGDTLASLLDGWHPHDAAYLIGTDQPRVSDIRRGKLTRFSLETLIRYLTRLGWKVELTITKSPPRPRGR
ncbi:MAG TPA: XRE family transcriptional regulator [Gemmatimonadaceae bacterium]